MESINDAVIQRAAKARVEKFRQDLAARAKGKKDKKAQPKKMEVAAAAENDQNEQHGSAKT